MSLDYPDKVQDLGDILYNFREQGPHERYIEYAQRLLDALEAEGWTLTPPPNGSSEAIINIKRMVERYEIICSRCGLVAVDLSAQEAHDEQRRHRCPPTT